MRRDLKEGEREREIVFRMRHSLSLSLCSSYRKAATYAMRKRSMETLLHNITSERKIDTEGIRDQTRDPGWKKSLCGHVEGQKRFFASVWSSYCIALIVHVNCRRNNNCTLKEKLSSSANKGISFQLFTRPLRWEREYKCFLKCRTMHGVKLLQSALHIAKSKKGSEEGEKNLSLLSFSPLPQTAVWARQSSAGRPEPP